MRHLVDKRLCTALGLSNGLIRVPYAYKNLWWSFDNGQSAFGYGDLNKRDLDNIMQWLKSDPKRQVMVFTGWNEHHGTDWQQTDYPIVRISVRDGITFPYEYKNKHRDNQ